MIQTLVIHYIYPISYSTGLLARVCKLECVNENVNALLFLNDSLKIMTIPRPVSGALPELFILRCLECAAGVG